MPVLKQHHNTPAMREAIVLDLGDIGAQADRIRAAAESQAAQIVSNAKQQSEIKADALYSDAQEMGHAEGLEKGLAEGREQGRVEALAESAEQLRQLMAAWSQVATDWEQQRADMEREARQAVLEFALSTAEKLVHRVIEVDESIVVDQAAQALSLVLSAHDASVRIHPVDRPMLEDAMPQLISELGRLEHIDLVDDEEITPGGCVVAFGQGRIDATIERQLQRLVDMILPEPPQLPEESPAVKEVSLPTMPQTSDISDLAEAVQMTEPTGPAPVYEITDQGLTQTQGDGLGSLNDSAVEHQDPVAEEQNEPESEA